MRSVWKVSALLLLSVPLFLFAAYGIWRTDRSCHPEGPCIKLDSPECRLGVVGYDEAAVFTIRFSNAGNSVLRISKVTSGCKCTVFELEKRHYMPGEEGVVRGQFQAKGPPGTVASKNVFIYSNDARNPVSRIKLIAEMKPALSIVPREIHLGQVSVGESCSADIVVAAMGLGAKFKIESTSSDIQGSNVTVFGLSASALQESPLGAASSSESNAYRVVLEFPAPGVPGPLAGNIAIRTSSELSPSINVPVDAQIIPSIIAKPERLFGIAKPGQSSEVRTVSFLSDYPFLLFLSDDESGIITKYAAGSAAGIAKKEWGVEVCFQRKEPSGDHEGILRFKIMEHPFQDEIEVPYSWLVVD